MDELKGAPILSLADGQTDLVAFDPARGLTAAATQRRSRERVRLQVLDRRTGEIRRSLWIDVTAVDVLPGRALGNGYYYSASIELSIHCPFEPPPSGIPAKVTFRVVRHDAADAAYRYELLTADAAFGDSSLPAFGTREMDTLASAEGMPIKRRLPAWRPGTAYRPTVIALVAYDGNRAPLRERMWGLDRVPSTHAISIRLHALRGGTDGLVLGFSGQYEAGPPVRLGATDSLQFEKVTYFSARPLVSAVGGTFEWLMELRGTPKQELQPMSLWNSAVCRPYIDALRLLSGGQDLTFLPEFESISAEKEVVTAKPSSPDWGGWRQWRLRYRVIETEVINTLDSPNVAPMGRRTAGCTAFVSQAVLEYAGRGPRHISDVSIQPEPLPFRAQLSNLSHGAAALGGLILPSRNPDSDTSAAVVSGSGAYPQWPDSKPPLIDLANETTIDGMDVDLIGGISLSGQHYAPTGDPPRPGQHVRIGALDLMLPYFDTATSSCDAELSFTLRAYFGRPAHAGGRSLPQIFTEQVIDLCDVRAGGDDPTGPGNGGDSAIIVAIDHKKDQRLRARLFVNEWCDGRTLPHAVTLRLVRTGGTSVTQSLYVLDAAPLSIARLEVRIGEPINAAESNEIALWHRDDGWRLTNRAPIAVTLPPQVLGEAFIRGAATIGYPDPGAASPVPADSRFAPVTRLTVQSSDRERNLDVAPWNVRRIFGGTMAELPGAVLSRVQTELLYGLGCELNASATQLRIAEMFARIGDVVSRQLPTQLPWAFVSREQAELYNAFRADRMAVLRAIMARVAVLEAYDQGSRSELVVESGLTFTLRRLGGPQMPGIDSDSALTMRDPFAPNPTPPGPDGSETADNRRQRYALPGGAIWGFEQKPLLDVALKERVSNVGKLIAPRFSALGGWGHQKAEYDQGKTLIQSDTAMGRTSSYSIERIGRIGCFWNLAKHVIQYERTVRAVRRFTRPRGDNGPTTATSQPPYEGLALVRKVDEYIEILRPLRRYPDAPSMAMKGTPVDAGPVRGIEFKTVRIPIDSSWSRSSDEGWTVPLWRQDANADDFPKPIVQLILSIDAAAGEARRTIDDPDKLVFFTTFDASQTKDTDTWPAVEGVDFPDAPPHEFATVLDAIGNPIALPGGGPSLNAQDPDAHLPDAFAVAGGLSAFTWSLSPVGEPININAGRLQPNRDDAPLGAVLVALHNVSMARSDPRTGGAAAPLAAWAAHVDAVKAHLRDALGEADLRLREIVAHADPATLQNVADTKLATVRNKLLALAGDVAPLRQAFKNISEVNDKVLQAEAWQKQAAAWSKRVRGEAGKVGGEFEKARQDAIDTVAAIGNVTPERSEQLMHDIAGQIALSVPRLPLAIDEAASRVQAAVSQIGLLVAQFQTVLRDLDARAAAVVDASWLKATLVEAVDRVDTLSRDFNRTTAELATRAKAIGDGFASVFDEHLPKLKTYPDPNDAAHTVAKRVDNIVVAVRDTLSKAVDDLSTQMAAFRDEFKSAWQQGADAEAKFAEQFRAKLQQINADYKAAVTGAAKAVSDEADAIKASVGTAIARFEKQIRDEAAPVVKHFNDIEGSLLVAYRNATGQGIAKVQNALDTAASFKTELGDPATLKDKIAGYLGWEKFVDHTADEFNSLCQNVQLRIVGLPTIAADKLQGVAQDLLNDLAGQVGQQVAQWEQAAGNVARRARPLVDQTTAVYRKGSNVIRTLRAFGDAPTLPGLVFNRKRIAYGLAEANDAIKLTPVGALFDRAGEALKALGIRLPTKELADRFKPDLANLNLSTLLPDVAGLKLSTLFQGVKVPDGVSDRVKLTHGLDEKSRQAWAAVDINIPVDDKTLVDWGPIRIDTLKTNVAAHAGVKIDDQGTHADKSGVVTADWQLAVGGTTIVTFEKTALSFNNEGKIKFDIKPAHVRLADVLKFISDMISSADSGDEPDDNEADDSDQPKLGFTIRPIRVDGVPLGIESRLSLKLPDTQTVTSGYANLALGVAFGVLVDTRDGFDFKLRVGFHFASREQPFTIVIFVLGGAGYVDAMCEYSPVKRQLAARVELAIYVAASLAISIGPVQGGVYAYLGIEGSFATGPGGALAISALFILRGDVSVAGIVTVSLVLTLQLIYRIDSDGKYLLASGTLSLQIKICWCFTIKVRVGVTYRFKTGEPSRLESTHEASAEVDDAVNNQVSSLK